MDAFWRAENFAALALATVSSDSATRPLLEGKSGFISPLGVITSAPATKKGTVEPLPLSILVSEPEPSRDPSLRSQEPSGRSSYSSSLVSYT